ncbi:MAG: hypothetical protein LBU82_08185 [Treponema sp.]|nr:hypothetical protein [Treponema sp.]
MYSQEEKFEAVETTAVENAEAAYEPVEPEKKKTDFARKYFEIGVDAGAGLDNGFIRMDKILKENIVLELSELAHGGKNRGAGLNVGLIADFFMKAKNISIGNGVWDFGLFTCIEGNIGANISKSLLTLIGDGNIDEHDSSGGISVSGGLFTEISLTGSAKFKIAGKNLYIGVKPSVFTPALYIPSDSGISYTLSTKKDGKDGIYVKTEGEINIYTPTSLEEIDPLRFVFGPSGFDLSLEGEYSVFPFLDIGGSFSNIPFSAAALQNKLTLGMTELNIPLSGEALMKGEVPEIPDIEFKRIYNDSDELKVRRLLRFDLYARYKPFNSELIVIRPNIGFSANINKGDRTGYFNAGMEAGLNINNLFTFHMGFGYRETILSYKAGLGFNLRAFELDLEAAFREQLLGVSFMGRGISVNVGLRFGW